jgi:hypothetical protein
VIQPFLTHRLAVVVGVEDHGAARAGHSQLGIHRRRGSGRGGEQPRAEAALFQLLFDVGRVPLHIGDIGRDVRHREEPHVVGDDGVLVLEAPATRRIADLRGIGGQNRRRRRHENCRRRQQEP